MIALRQSLNPAHDHRTVIVGVGQEIRGDDAAALVVVRALKLRLTDAPHVLVIEAGLAPESFIGVIRRFAPDRVVLIDSAQMDETPGTIRWLAIDQISGMSGSSHTLPLNVIAAYLRLELACEVALIGIQPGGTAIDQPLSPAVRAAADQLAQVLADTLMT